MIKFMDAEKRAWVPEVNVVTIGRVREHLKINLLELLFPDNTLADRLTDPCLLVDILYLLCKDHADSIGVDETAFGKAMLPDGIDDGWGMVLQGIVLFSPRGMRPAHQKVLVKAKEYQVAAAEKIKAIVKSPEFDAVMDRELEERLNPPEKWPTESTGDASSLPESSESSLAATLSEP